MLKSRAAQATSTWTSSSVLDLDLVLDLVLTAAGFRLAGEFPHSVNFRHPNAEPVQLAFDPAFDEMISRAERVTLGALEIPVVTRADLIAMKERAAADPALRHSKRLRVEADVALRRGEASDPDEGW